MPVILKFGYTSGKEEVLKIPAEVWRKNEAEIHKTFVFDEKLEYVLLDPNKEIADINKTNNRLPRETSVSRFEEYKNSTGK